jgi:predicted nuclease of predicted toxin-antitoxin system
VKLWLDAQFSPALAAWMRREFGLDEAWAIQTDVELRGLKDREIFDRARRANVVVMTKDRDFVDLLERLGPPPQVLWVTCGNTSNLEMRRILATACPAGLALLRSGDPLVEISGRSLKG